MVVVVCQPILVFSLGPKLNNKAKTNVFNVTFFIASKNVHKIWYFLNPHLRLFFEKSKALFIQFELSWIICNSLDNEDFTDIP